MIYLSFSLVFLKNLFLYVIQIVRTHRKKSSQSAPLNNHELYIVEFPIIL